MSGSDGPPPLTVELGPVLRLICRALEALKKCASKLQDAICGNDANRLRPRLDRRAESCHAAREVGAMDLIDTIRELARRVRLERDSGADSNEEAFRGFTARLRFRVRKRLEITEYEQDVEFGPYKATLLGQNKGQPIRDSDWLVDFH
jgi:hypothetical protein